MAIVLIDKIAPKNDAFVGMVDANQVLGGVGSTLPDNTFAPSNIFQFGSPVFGIYVSGTTGSAIGKVIFTGSTNITIERTGSEFKFTSAGASAGSSTYQHRWTANGPYQTDTEVDGAYISDSAFSVTGIWMWRGVSGTAGSTIVDINKNGVTMYTTQENRPNIAFNDADKKIDATLPDIVEIAQGDIITLDIDIIDTGSPKDLIVQMEGK